MKQIVAEMGFHVYFQHKNPYFTPLKNNKGIGKHSLLWYRWSLLIASSRTWAMLLKQPGCYSGGESWLETELTSLFNKPRKEYEVIVLSQRQANLKDDGSKGILVPTLSAAVTAEVGQ